MLARGDKEAALAELVELAEAQEIPLELGKVAAGIAQCSPVEDWEKRLAGKMLWE
jgi:hypothetical protein